MKQKFLILFCFLFPFIFNGLNLQGWLSIYISATVGQIFAYLNLVLLVFGISKLARQKRDFSKTSSLWFYFFLIYFSFSLIASVIHSYPIDFIKDLVPIIYCAGYMFFLTEVEYTRYFEKTTTIIFLIANIVLIIFVQLNFDYDFYDVKLEFELDRAQGVYGDANNAALVAILGYIFLARFYKPQKKIGKVLKITLIAISFYALFLTYSTTGFVAFAASFCLINFKHFTKERLVILPIILIGFYALLLNSNTLLENFDLNPRQKYKIENFVNLLSFNLDEVDNSGRDDFILEIIEYIEKNPFIGNGHNFGIKHHSHNTFIYIWSDAGVFALFFFLILLYIYTKKALFLNIKSKLFVLAIMATFFLFMLSLQSVINQPYLMCVFIYLGYLVDFEKKYL